MLLGRAASNRKIPGYLVFSPEWAGVLITWSLLLFNTQWISTEVRHHSVSIKDSSCLQPVCISERQHKETQGMKCILETYWELAQDPWHDLHACLGMVTSTGKEMSLPPHLQLQYSNISQVSTWPSQEGILKPRVIQVSHHGVSYISICRRQHFISFNWGSIGLWYYKFHICIHHSMLTTKTSVSTYHHTAGSLYSFCPSLCLLSHSVQFSSVTQSCPTLCNPMNCSTPGLPVHHQLPEFTQTHVHRVSGAIQPSHPLSSPSPPPSQHQSLFQWVNSSHEVAKYWSFSFSIGPSKEIPGLISFRMDWLDLLAVQGTLKSLLQHHSSKASVLRPVFSSFYLCVCLAINFVCLFIFHT